TARALYSTPGTLFIETSPERLQRTLAQDPALARHVAENPKLDNEPAQLTTDDWPYFYQRAPGLPLNGIVISAALVLLAWALVRRAEGAARGLDRHFFFLGGGFMLLEAQIVSKMALLFGTTWMVNSIVVAGLLLLIVLANQLVAW